MLCEGYSARFRKQGVWRKGLGVDIVAKDSLQEHLHLS
jgi:hypothetical protein